MNPLELTLAYEFKDWVHFCRVMVRRNPRLFGGLALFGVVPLITGQGIGAAVSADIFFVGSMSAYMLLLHPYLQARCVQRSVTAAGPQPIRIVLDENGLHTDNNGVRGDVPWSSIGTVIETKRALALRVGKTGSLFLMPRRLLTDADYAAARRWVDGRVLQGADFGQSCTGRTGSGSR